MFSTLVASRPGRAGGVGALAGLTSIVLHVGVVALLLWATMNVGRADEPDPEILIDLRVVRAPAPPPPPPAPPVIDEVPEPPVVEDLPGGRIVLTPPDVVLPGIPLPSTDRVFDPRAYTDARDEGDPHGTAEREVTSDDADAAIRTVPMTVVPTIRNRDEVARALRRLYPPLLRDAGIGGTVIVWIRVDENGSVVRTQLHESSGQPGLDEAALRIGEVIEFTPAQNRDRRIPVWIQWPITFRPM